MGFFSNIGKSLGFGGDADEGTRAAEQIRIANEKANQELQSQFDISRGEVGTQQGQLRSDFLRQLGINEAGFDPFVDIGQGAARNLQQSSTAEGFNELLARITGGDTFGALRGEAESAGTRLLESQGLASSGTGLKEISQISPQLALQLAGNLTQNQQFLSGQGLNAAGGRSQAGNQLFSTQGGLSNSLTQFLAMLRQNLAGGKAGNITGTGRAESSGILTNAQIDNQRFQNLLDVFSTGASFIPGGGGGSVQGSSAGGPPGGVSDREFIFG